MCLLLIFISNRQTTFSAIETYTLRKLVPENEELSWCQLCRYWRHRMFLLWQPSVPPVKTKLAENYHEIILGFLWWHFMSHYNQTFTPRLRDQINETHSLHVFINNVTSVVWSCRSLNNFLTSQLLTEVKYAVGDDIAIKILIRFT